MKVFLLLFQAVQRFLEEINRVRLRRELGPVPWTTGVKFVMARKFDVRRAVELFYAHEVGYALCC